jgi:hypothetical protein
MDWYPWVVLAHVIGAFGFVFAHGVSAFVAFRLRAARTSEQVATLIGLSGNSITLAYASLLVLLVAGIAAGFMGSWWGAAWIWVSIGLLLAIATAMYLVGTKYYIEVRHAVGLPTPQDPRGAPFEPVDPDALARLLDSRRPELLAAIGGGGLAALIALMVLKPG